MPRSPAEPRTKRAMFPHDLEQIPPSRHDRWPEPPGGRSDHVPHAVEHPDPERRGGRDREERKRA